MKRRLVNKTSC